MKTLLTAAIMASALAVPSLASAQTTDVRVRATVSGEWVLNPRLCPDLREDRRDSRVTTSRRDRREDRRDARIVDCPASAYSFVPDAGQAPNRPIRVAPGPVQRRYQGVQPSYTQPSYTQPRYAPQPAPPSNYIIRNGRIIFTD